MKYERGWQTKGACNDEDPELFFPIGSKGPAALQIEEAKAVSRRCNVREQCLAWALENEQGHGVWGGMSEDERRALIRRAARASARPQDQRRADPEREEAERVAREAAELEAAKDKAQQDIVDYFADVGNAFGSYDETSPTY